MGVLKRILLQKMSFRTSLSTRRIGGVVMGPGMLHGTVPLLTKKTPEKRSSEPQTHSVPALPPRRVPTSRNDPTVSELERCTFFSSSLCERKCQLEVEQRNLEDKLNAYQERTKKSIRVGERLVALEKESLEATDHREEHRQQFEHSIAAKQEEIGRILCTFHDVYKRVPEPFDLPYLLGLEWTDDKFTSALTDWRCQMPFTGRSDFLLNVLKKLSYVVNKQASKPLSVVYGSGSGTGKTAALLQLQHFFQVVAKDPIALAQWVAADERHKPLEELFTPHPTVPPPRPPSAITTPDKPHQHHEYLLVYCGFGGNLALSREEKRWMELRGNSGAEDVLARRVLGMTAYALANRTRVGVLPSYEQIFGGREIPPHAESFRILKDLLVRNQQQSVPLRLVVGLDDVHCLDGESLKLAYRGACGIGRFFLQMLQRWTVIGDGMIALPIATSMAANLRSRPHEATTCAIDGGDTSVIYPRDFETLAREMLSQVEPKDDAFQRRFGIAKDASARWLTAVLWPCVRSLQHLPAWIGGGAPCAATSATTATESGATGPHTVQKNMNSEEKEEGKQDHSLQMHFTAPKVPAEALPQWRKMYFRYLCKEIVGGHEFATVNEQSRATFPFSLAASDYVNVFPTGLTSNVLVDAFLAKEPASLHPMIKNLPTVTSVDRDHPFSTESFCAALSSDDAHNQCFAQRAFSVVGCALHIGLRGLSPAAKHGTPPTAPVTPLAMWALERLALMQYDKILDKARCLYSNDLDDDRNGGKDNSFPFSIDAKQTPVFHADVEKALAKSSPLYICAQTILENDTMKVDNRNTNATFFYMMPFSEKRWVAVICIPKMVAQSEPPPRGKKDTYIRIDDQIQLLNTCTRLAHAMTAAGHSLVAARLAFFTNGDGRLESPSSAGHTDAKALDTAQQRAQKAMGSKRPCEWRGAYDNGIKHKKHDEDLFLVLKPGSFEFAPFSGLLFAAPFLDNAGTAL